MTTTASQQVGRETPQATAEPAFPQSLQEQVAAYLRKLGLKDPALIDSIAAACLQRASRRAAPGANAELLRRALEEVQRRFDHALAQFLHLQGSMNLHALAAARAALLLGDTALDVDRLMLAHEAPPDDFGAVSQALPQATPPESRLPMHEQPISFFFTRPSHSRI